MATKIGERRPDGIGGDTPSNEPQIDERKGEKIRAEEDDVPIVPEGVPHAPAGLAALEGMEGDRKVTLINLQLGTLRFEEADWTKPQIKESKKQPTRKRKIAPFASFEVRVDVARVLLETQSKGRGTRGAHMPKVVVAPPKGDCKRQQWFITRKDGRRWATCVHADCPHHSDGNRAWSVWMAQHFVRLKHRGHVIRKFVQQLDTRSDVAIFGLTLADERDRTQRERMGMGNSDSLAIH